MYQQYEQAVEALLEARTRFDYARNTGPVAVYQCEECGHYHLTSQGEMNPTLEKHLANGKIQLQAEANRWIDKLKKR